MTTTLTKSERQWLTEYYRCQSLYTQPTGTRQCKGCSGITRTDRTYCESCDS